MTSKQSPCCVMTGIIGVQLQCSKEHAFAGTDVLGLAMSCLPAEAGLTLSANAVQMDSTWYIYQQLLYIMHGCLYSVQHADIDT